METTVELGALQKIAGESGIKRCGQRGNDTHTGQGKHQESHNLHQTVPRDPCLYLIYEIIRIFRTGSMRPITLPGRFLKRPDGPARVRPRHFSSHNPLIPKPKSLTLRVSYTFPN